MRIVGMKLVSRDDATGSLTCKAYTDKGKIVPFTVATCVSMQDELKGRYVEFADDVAKIIGTLIDEYVGVV